MSGIRPIVDNECARTSEQPVTVSDSPDNAEFNPARADWNDRLLDLRQSAKLLLLQLSDSLAERTNAAADSLQANQFDGHLISFLENVMRRQNSLEETVNIVWSAMDSENSTRRPVEQANAPPAWAFELRSILVDRLTAFESNLQHLSESMNSMAISHIATAESSGNEESAGAASEPESPGVDSPYTTIDQNRDDWLNVMLGPELLADPRLSDSIDWIKQSILAGDTRAMSLLGQLLVFRCANSERKPALLKDIGETYYRCFPKSQDQNQPLEMALAEWSTKQCEIAGLPNSIELVHRGERVDAAKHSPVERGGVEVSEVLGWIVLRDGGRVFSKASVKTR